MKTLAFASALLASATLLAPALADGLVPGSDHYVEADADAAAHSVATGLTAPVVTSSVTETRSFGYPETASAATGAPGSRTKTHARDDAASDAVSRGASSGRGATVTGLFSGTVPGSAFH